MGQDMTSRLAALPDRLRLPWRFDAARLGGDLARLRAIDWTPHFVPDNYTGDWSVLPLRAPAGASHPILRIVSNPGAVWEDTELLAACPYFRAILDGFACPIGAARLMRLGPGSDIHEHRDDDLAPEYGTARLHIPVATNADVDFRLNGRRVDMAVGETWYLRLADRHRVANRGTTDRIHLVIDATVDDWLADALLAAA